ncbi:MAG: hypothetical protein U0R24_12990 [Solirubrobacterales bacterium]
MAARDAIFASVFERATPTLIGSPSSSRTWRRSFAAIHSAVPEMRSRPPTSRKASSSERPSTVGAVLRKTAKSSLLALVYSSKCGSTVIASGQSRSAVAPVMPPFTPHAFAS